MTTEMTAAAIKDALTAIGSVYVGGLTGWRHQDAAKGKELVSQLVAINRQVSASREVRPAAWGKKGERGTVVCLYCGKRGQDKGLTCDSCGHVV